MSSPLNGGGVESIRGIAYEGGVGGKKNVSLKVGWDNFRTS
jgi:hypothetical protein